MTTLAGPLVPLTCSGYEALRKDTTAVQTAYYIVDGKLWGFGLAARAREPVPVIDLDDVQAAARRARRRRPPHAGLHVAHARRARRRVGAPEGRVLPARRRVQVPRRVQQDRVARRSTLRARRARVLVRQPRAGGRDRGDACSARTRRSSCRRTRRPRKLDATRGYGAEIVTYDRWTENREEIGARLAEERGLELVKPYDDPLVMAGQGTTALELLEDVQGSRRARRRRSAAAA